MPMGFGHTKMTAAQFKNWFESMDKNHDGQISKEELKEALRSMGLHFVGLKAWRAMANADHNHNHVIDPPEMDDLIAYAKKHWGVVIDRT